ncbi:hypothetical protein LJE82_12000 [bacterium BMS3Abin03]|nr:hypothetical protein [bacterium BMS3Abin03]
MNNFLIKVYQLTFPFSLLAVFFIAIGFILNEHNQVYFGVVWLLIAVIAFIVRKLQRNK